MSEYIALSVSNTKSKAGKYAHGKFADDGTTHSIPAPLAHAFEQLVIGRQLLGEENDSLFGQNLLVDLIELWNANIEKLKEDVTQAVGSDAIAKLNMAADGEDQHFQEQLAKDTKKLLENIMQDLKTIVIHKTPAALRNLGSFQKLLYSIDFFIYMIFNNRLYRIIAKLNIYIYNTKQFNIFPYIYMKMSGISMCFTYSRLKCGVTALLAATFHH